MRVATGSRCRYPVAMPKRAPATDPDRSKALIDALKRALRARGMTYADLAPKPGLSEASVKRVFSRRTLTLARLLEICAVLELDLAELAKLARVAADAKRELSEVQEAALAADPKLLLVFHLLLAGWRVPAIRERYELSAQECERALLRLARLNLIEVGARERVRLRVPRGFSWRRDGPMRERYGGGAPRAVPPAPPTPPEERTRRSGARPVQASST